MALDYAAGLATDDGFDLDREPDELIACLVDETFGNRHVAKVDAGVELDASEWWALQDDTDF